MKAHHERLQRNQEQQKALEQARSQENRGQLSKEFNREQARQNLREQFQEKSKQEVYKKQVASWKLFRAYLLLILKSNNSF